MNKAEIFKSIEELLVKEPEAKGKVFALTVKPCHPSIQYSTAGWDIECFSLNGEKIPISFIKSFIVWNNMNDGCVERFSFVKHGIDLSHVLNGYIDATLVATCNSDSRKYFKYEVTYEGGIRKKEYRETHLAVFSEVPEFHIAENPCKEFSGVDYYAQFSGHRKSYFIKHNLLDYVDGLTKGLWPGLC